MSYPPPTRKEVWCPRGPPLPRHPSAPPPSPSPPRPIGAVTAISELEVDALIAAVHSCHGVSSIATVTDYSRLTPGRSGPAAISYDADTVDISIIAFTGHRLSEVVARVEASVRPLIGTRTLNVTVEDLDPSPGPGSRAAPPPPPTD